jgi:peptide chain release factor 1
MARKTEGTISFYLVIYIQQELNHLNVFIADEKTEAELVSFAKSDLKDCLTKLQEIEKQLLSSLIPKDSTDTRNAILEVRPGRNC